MSGGRVQLYTRVDGTIQAAEAAEAEACDPVWYLSAATLYGTIQPAEACDQISRPAHLGSAFANGLWSVPLQGMFGIDVAG